jgi:eukaryotic-like serine/threonine-protein kinase
VMGTPRYMSPEQARGEKADARTDIFSVGVMIYEMIAGCPPFSGETSNEVIASILKDEPVPVTSHVSDAAPEIERILDKSLRKDRRERYQSASELLEDLKQLKQDLEFTSEKKKRSGQVNASHPTTNKRNLMAILALAGFVIAATIAWSYLKRAPVLASKDTILLADFENKTGDDVFNGPLKQGLAIQLQQSPFLQLFPEPQVRQTLRLMGRQPTEEVTAEVAREICERKELKAFIAGSIAPLGSDYVITLDAINGQTGDVVAQALVQAGDKEQVLKALSQATTQLREKLGESLRSIQQFNRPLQEVTTSNLMAYKDAIAGMDHAVSGRHRDAIPFFERAIEIDDGFAYAHLVLAISYSLLGHMEVAERYAEKAYALRDRAGEIEKSRIIEFYHGLVTGNIHERIKTLALHRQTFPQEYTGPNDLALCYNQIGQFDQALIEARESIRLNPLFAGPYGHLAVANLRLNRFNEGNDALTQAVQQGLHSAGIHATLYQLASMKGDTLGMRQQITWAEGRADSYIAFEWQAATAASKGQWLKSQELSRRASDLAVSAKVKDLAAQYTTERAARGAVFGDCRRATVDAAEGLALARTRASLSRAALALALCGETNRAKPVIDEIARRYPEDTLINSIWLPSIRAAMDLRSDDSAGRAAQAIEHLQPATRYEAAAEFWPQYLRGLAYLKLGKAAEAATEFKKILDHRGQGLLSPLYPLAYLGSAQAAALSGDMAASRKAYESLLSEWKDADSNLLTIFKPEKSDKLRGRIH